MSGNSEDRDFSAIAVTTEDDESMEDTLTMRSSPRDTSQEPLLAIEATSTTSTTPPATENEDLPTRRSQHDMILANLPPLLSEIDAREPGGGVWNRRSKNTRYRPYIGKWMQEPIDLPYWEMYYGSCRPVSSSEDHISRPRDPLHLEMYGDNTAASEDRSDKETESQHSGTIEDEREEAEDDEAAAEPRCTVCQKEFSDNDLLDDHLVSCHRYPPDQFKCESCPKGFSWKPCLYRHRVSEHGEVRRYPCENCTKVFTDPSNLQRHIRTHHVGARSHACPECGKTFATSSGLKQHTHIHSSVKPFQCEVCFKAYTQFSNLCRHKRMHANCRMQIKCPKCGQSFSTVTSLSKHRRFCDSTTPNGTPTSSALPAGSATIMSHIPHSGPPQSPIILFPPHPPTRFPYPLSPYPPIFHHHPPIPPFGSSVLFPSNVDDPLKRLNFHFPPEPLRPHFGEYEGRKRSHALWNGLPNCSPAKKIKRPFETSPNGLREYNITPPSMSPPNKISPPPADEAFSRPSPARPIHSQRVSYPDPREVIAASNPQSFGESDSTEELTENGNENSPKDLTLNKSIDQADEKHLPPVYDVNIGDKSLKCIENVKKLNGEQPLDLRVDRKRKCETPESSTGKTIFCPPAPETPPKEQEEIKIKHEQGIPEKVAESSPVKTPYSCPKTPLSISEMISPTTNNIPSIAYRPRPIHPVPLPPDMYRTPFLNFPLPSPGNERPIPQAPIIPYGSMRNFSFFSQFNGLNGHVGGRVSFDPRNTPIHAFPGGKPYQNVLPPHIPSSTTSNDVTSGSSGKLKDRYSCKFCGKVFPRSANLTRHLRTHTGEQPYKCKYCERSFSISSNLQRHVRNIHNKEKPFKCPLCDRCFGQQTNLDRHLKKHEADDGSGVVSVADSPDSSNENERDESYFDEIRSFMGKVTPYPSGSYTNDPIVSNYNMHTPVFQSPHVSDLVSIVNKDDEDSDIPSEENSPPNLLDRTSHHDDRLQELQEESPLEMVVNKDLVNSPLSFEVKLKAENTLKNAESTNNNCPEQESIEVVT